MCKFINIFLELTVLLTVVLIIAFILRLRDLQGWMPTVNSI